MPTAEENALFERISKIVHDLNDATAEAEKMGFTVDLEGTIVSNFTGLERYIYFPSVKRRI